MVRVEQVPQLVVQHARNLRRLPTPNGFRVVVQPPVLVYPHCPQGAVRQLRHRHKHQAEQRMRHVGTLTHQQKARRAQAFGQCGHGLLLQQVRLAQQGHKGAYLRRGHVARFLEARQLERHRAGDVVHA